MVSMFSLSFKWPGFCLFVCLFLCPFVLPCHSGLQPNLLSFPQQQSTLLLPQTGPGLTSQVTATLGKYFCSPTSQSTALIAVTPLSELQERYFPVKSSI